MTKTVTYDRKERRHRAELDGRFVGYFDTREEAEQYLDRLVYDALTHGA